MLGRVGILNGELPNSPMTVRGGVWLDGRLDGNGNVGAPVILRPRAGLSPGQGSHSSGQIALVAKATRS